MSVPNGCSGGIEQKHLVVMDLTDFTHCSGISINVFEQSFDKMQTQECHDPTAKLPPEY